jgi:23S rRNA (adenine2503-C2)-methyltransferase
VNEVAARTNLLDLDRTGLERFFAEELGEKRFRAHQVMKWMYHRHVTDFAEMTDLGKALRAKLEDRAIVSPPPVQFEKPVARRHAQVAARRRTRGAIESVFIPDKGRGTLCVSSQVGCGLACTFCSTGTQGFNRNLSTAEIIGQVWVAAKHLGNVPHHQRKLTNVVMMGMGEPLLNFDNVVRAMSLMRDDNGFGLANKRVTLSTAGMVPMIDRSARRAMCSLAVSLHAPIDELARHAGAAQQEVPDRGMLMDACVRYAERKPRTSITFEYTMMKGINDQPEQARCAGEADAQGRCARAARQRRQGQPDPFNPLPGHALRALRRRATSAPSRSSCSTAAC